MGICYSQLKPLAVRFNDRQLPDPIDICIKYHNGKPVAARVDFQFNPCLRSTPRRPEYGKVEIDTINFNGHIVTHYLCDMCDVGCLFKLGGGYKPGIYRQRWRLKRSEYIRLFGGGAAVATEAPRPFAFDDSAAELKPIAAPALAMLQAPQSFDLSRRIMELQQRADDKLKARIKAESECVKMCKHIERMTPEQRIESMTSDPNFDQMRVEVCGPKPDRNY